MSDQLNENAITLLGSVDSVDLNAADNTETTLYTVPTGKKCCPHHARIRNLSATATSVTCTIGKNGAETDFLNTQTLTNLNAAKKTAILSPVPAATPAIGIEYDAGDVIVFVLTNPQGTAVTCTVDLFGTLDDA